MTSTWRIAVVVASGLLAAACGGGGGGDVAEYCKLVAASETDPTEADLDDAVDAAPSEIKDDVRKLREAYEASADDPSRLQEIFADPDMLAASTRVSNFHAEHCDGGEPAG
ncbi:MAG TPA: hypothetical protein VI916_11590 [Acidimicrobiia bacterium]|nr:hypothetical protein [Acidimicrobiia bacterium]